MPRKTKPASLLELRLLGSFRLVRGEQAIQLATHKSESLLAYLALHPETHAREKLAAIFWGESSDLQARTSLRTALAALHKNLGPETILADRETMQINPGAFCRIDALEFFRLLNPESAESHQAEIGNLESAVALYQGDLLPDFYDDWILAERERYCAMYCDALLSLTQKMRARSEYQRAMEYAQRILRMDPVNERAHQHLMFCYLAMGKRLEALKQYDECKQILMEELDAEPSRATVALYESIQRADDAPKSREAAITNLPIPVTSFVGRDAELAEVKQLFADTRLLTLTGAGGIGKTRLAKQVAYDLVDQFTEGAWFIELVELTDSARVPQAIAKTMGVREVTSDESVEQILLRALTPRHILMVLDNCEHLVEACAHLCERLLATCPKLKILATSREVLGIPGETIWRVPVLKAPEAGARIDSALMLMQFDAVRLFVERATSASTNFELNDQNALAVAQICQRLDGIPLALELAAARIKTLSAKQIAEKLDDRFRLLTGGSRTALPRYQTLRALIDWSYDFLSEDERALFRRLSVFGGGWTLEAAEQVCSGQWVVNGKATADQHSPTQVLDLLSRLVDKSLVLMDAGSGEPRFRFLETIRQYARDKLLGSDEATPIRNCHRDWFLQFAEQTEPHLRSADQANWVNRLELESENLRAALEWSLGRQGAAEDTEKGLRLAGALVQFWAMHGYLTEGRTWIDQALKQSEHARVGSDQAKARALVGAGVLACLHGDWVRTAEYGQSSLALARQLEDKWLMGVSLYVLGEYARNHEHDFSRAQSTMSEGLALARASGDNWLVALMLYSSGANAQMLSDWQLANDFLGEALELCREIGEVWLSAAIVDHLGALGFLNSDFERASSLYQESLRLRRELHDKSGVAGSLNNLGQVARAQRDYVRAQALFEESLALFGELGHQESVAIILHNLGYIAKHQNDLPQARAYFEQGLALFGKLSNTEGIGDCLAGLASVAVEHGNHTFAARLLGATQAILGTIDAHLSPTDLVEFESSHAVVCAALGEPTAESLMQQGRSFSVDMAMAYALKSSG